MSLIPLLDTQISSMDSTATLGLKTLRESFCNLFKIPADLVHNTGVTIKAINVAHTLILNCLAKSDKCTAHETLISVGLAVTAIALALVFLRGELGPVSCWGSSGPVARRVSDFFNLFPAFTVGCAYMQTWYLEEKKIPTPLYVVSVAVSTITLALTILPSVWWLLVKFIAWVQKKWEPFRGSKEAGT